MAQATLNEVVISLKENNERLNSIEKNTFDTEKALQKFLDIQKAMAGDLLENQRERGGGPQGSDQGSGSNPPPGNNSFPLMPFIGSLGLIGKTVAAIGASFGVGLGLIVGQVKAIQAFIKAASPGGLGGITKSIDELKASWTRAINNIRSGVSTRISGLATILGNFFDNVKAKFVISPESNLGKAIAKITPLFTRVSTSLGALIAPFTAVADMLSSGGGGRTATIGSIASKLRFWFGSISTKIARLGGIIPRIASVVGKVFAPIAIIQTAWETITQAIEGYKEGGIIGGLEGAITGFFTSLITIPLDLVKDATAWLLAKVGLITPDTEESIKEFSFTDLFKGIVSDIFDKVTLAIDWFKTLFTDPVTAIQTLFEGIYGKDGLYDFLIFQPISKAIDWIAKSFGFKEEDAPAFDLYDTLTETYDKIKVAFTNGLTDIVNWFKRTPKLVAIEAESTFETAIAKIKKGFIGIASFMANIPNIIKRAIFSTLVDYKNNGTGGSLLPDFSENLEATNKAIASISGSKQSAIDEIDNQLAKRLSELDIQRQKVINENTRTPSVTSVSGDTTVDQSNNRGGDTYNMGGSSGFDNVDPTYLPADF